MVKTCKNESCHMNGMAITREGTEFCSKCGVKLCILGVCEYCAHNFYPNDKFCESCGRPVK